MLKENKEVDVMIITYNNENFIKETIESVLNQNYSNIRKIIIADDGSKDGTPDIINRYADKYHQIEPVLAKENKGIAHNVNRALKRINAEYVASLGGDDLMFPEKIKKQVEYLNNNPDVVVCSHDMDVYNSVIGQSMGRFSETINYKKFNEKVGIEYLFDPAMSLCPPSYMLRSEVIPKNGYDTRLKLLSELIFDTEVLMNGKMGYIDEVLGMYRRSGNNVSTNSARDDIGLEEFLIAYSIIVARYPELNSYVKRGKSALYFAKSMRCMMKGNKKRAKDLSKVLLAEGNYIKGTFAYLMSSLMSSNLLNKVYESKYQHNIIGLLLKSI